MSPGYCRDRLSWFSDQPIDYIVERTLAERRDLENSFDAMDRPMVRRYMAASNGIAPTSASLIPPTSRPAGSALARTARRPAAAKPCIQETARTPNCIRASILGTLLLAISSACCADQVSSESGNIYLTTVGGVRVQLTHSGSDETPAISPDGRSIAFLRALVPPSEIGDFGAYALFIVDIQTRREVLLYRPAELNPSAYAWVMSAGGPLAFSPDSELVYFTRSEAPTSSQVDSISRRGGPLRVVAEGTGGEYRLINEGRYSGCLLITLRTLRESGEGFVYPWVLIDRQGHELRRFPDDANIEDIQSSL